MLDTKEEFCKLKIQEEIPRDINTDFAENLGESMLDGDFERVQQYLNESSLLTIYGSKSISGKEKILEYWNAWRDRYILTKRVEEIKIAYSNYYSHACLLIDSTIVLFSLSNGVVTDMLLASRRLSPKINLNDDLMDFPLSVEGVQSILTSLQEHEENLGKVNISNRIPCFICRQKSENLEWHSFKVDYINACIMGQVSICSNCNKVVEFYPAIEQRFESEQSNINEELPF